MSSGDRGISAATAIPAPCPNLELLQLLYVRLYIPGALLDLLLQCLKSNLVLGGLRVALRGPLELLPEHLHLPTQLCAAVLLLLQALGTDAGRGDPAPPKPRVLCLQALKGSSQVPPPARALFLMSSQALWKFSVVS